jgi:hypothetical protein
VIESAKFSISLATSTVLFMRMIFFFFSEKKLENKMLVILCTVYCVCYLIVITIHIHINNLKIILIAFNPHLTWLDTGFPTDISTRISKGSSFNKFRESQFLSQELNVRPRFLNFKTLKQTSNTLTSQLQQEFTLACLIHQKSLRIFNELRGVQKKFSSLLPRLNFSG